MKENLPELIDILRNLRSVRKDIDRYGENYKSDRFVDLLKLLEFVIESGEKSTKKFLQQSREVKIVESRKVSYSNLSDAHFEQIVIYALGKLGEFDHAFFPKEPETFKVSWCGNEWLADMIANTSHEKGGCWDFGRMKHDNGYVLFHTQYFCERYYLGKADIIGYLVSDEVYVPGIDRLVTVEVE